MEPLSDKDKHKAKVAISILFDFLTVVVGALVLVTTDDSGTRILALFSIVFAVLAAVTGFRWFTKT